VSLACVCSYFGFSRQAYYRSVARAEKRFYQEALILDCVRLVRRQHPRMGTRKLLDLINPMLEQSGIRVGRDRLFELLRSTQLLVHRPRRTYGTTWPGRSRAPFLLAGLKVNQVNQVWVVDLTYVRLKGGGFAYVFLLMDLYSRFLLSCHVGGTLLAEEALAGLEQALAVANKGSLRGTIHHSDHGSQYCSGIYREMLEKHGLRASMGAVGNAYDNAYAERVIGTLKWEYLGAGPFRDLNQARHHWQSVRQLYNEYRPHLSLGMATPSEVFRGVKSGIPIQFPPSGNSKDEAKSL